MEVASAFGIPIRIHWTFAAVPLFFYATFGSVWVALVVTAVLFGSVLLHEFGHALAARRYGIGTAHITLSPLGGIAAIERMPRNPWQELVIALAGPAVNVVLLAMFLALYSASGWSILLYAALANGALGVFNLLPAFPMDGGRVLRALLATRMGWMKASHVAIRVGQVFAWCFVVVGVLTRRWDLLLMAGFLFFTQRIEQQRLVAIAWERARQGWTDWGSPDPWGKRPRTYRYR